MGSSRLSDRAEARRVVRFLEVEHRRCINEARVILRAIRVVCERYGIPVPLLTPEEPGE